MNASVPTPETGSQEKSSHHARARNAVALAFVTELLIAGGMLVLAVAPPSGRTRTVCEIALSALVMAFSFWLARRWRRLDAELSKLQQLIPEVLHGREPIESFSGIGDLAAPVAESCAELARELRRERARTNQLQDEVRQKVASRTEALERTIGALRQQAARDALTGLFNRRMLDAYLPEAIDRCKAMSQPLAMLMLDVDHFKPLNDSLGHAAGDQMLKSIAQIIRSTIGEEDLAFRNGGDEFVVVLEGCTADSARLKQERLNSLGSALGRTFRLTPPPALSVGLAMLSEVKEATAPALLRQADQSLYLVKAEHHAAASVPPPRRRSA